MDQTIVIDSEEDKKFCGYLSLPDMPSKRPGIVLIQEIFGVNPAIRDIADRLAKEGYVVLAPDLFWRTAPGVQLNYEGEDLEKAFNCYKHCDLKQGLKDIGKAIETLRSHPACSGRIAAMGFGFGGKLAYLTATTTSYDIDAMIAFYGVGIADQLDLAENISVPALMHFGEKDAMISSDQVDRIKKAFRCSESVSIYVYPGTEHAFYNPMRAAHHPEMALLAQERTLSFLRYTLVQAEVLV